MSSTKIKFNEIGEKLQLPKTKIRKWVLSIAQQYNLRIGEINYIFCNDDYLIEINRTYLEHDNYTDIITFDLSDPGERSKYSDIYISLERVRDNAAKHGTKLDDEILRVIIHGILHLCGFKDKNKTDKNQMREKESEAISRYFAMFHVK